MLRSTNEVTGYTIHATDGDIGHVDEFLFDDERWVIRYLVVDTGGWLPGRKVLISPIALGIPDWEAERLDVALTREQVENSPDIDTDKPVSRQHEIEYFRYYGWPYYWAGSGIWGAAPYPVDLAASGDLTPADASEGLEPDREQGSGDPHLQSTADVTGYSIEASDGEIGHVDDFLVDAETWAIRFLVVDTRNWWPGKKVLVAPESIARVSWSESKVFVNLGREAIKKGPEYVPGALIDLEYEMRLNEYHRLLLGGEK